MTTPESDFDLTATIREMSQRTDPSFAIIAASRVEDWLRASIQTRMRMLSNKETERLFSGYGPLSTFSAMIDVAYAFSLFNADIRNDLRAIKDIRNAFAHARDPLHFASEKLAPLIQKLTGWTHGTNA